MELNNVFFVSNNSNNNYNVQSNIRLPNKYQDLSYEK